MQRLCIESRAPTKQQLLYTFQPNSSNICGPRATSWGAPSDGRQGWNWPEMPKRCKEHFRGGCSHNCNIMAWIGIGIGIVAQFTSSAINCQVCSSCISATFVLGCRLLAELLTLVQDRAYRLRRLRHRLRQRSGVQVKGDTNAIAMRVLEIHR